MVLGSPGAPDQPFAARLKTWRSASDPTQLTAPELAAVLSEVVKSRPGDVEGRLLLARAQDPNLLSGFMSLWISDVEKEHPEIAYENAINAMVEKYSKLKRATAAIIRRRDEIRSAMHRRAKELAEVSQDLDVAVETNQDDLALILIQKKNLLEKEVADFKADLETAGKDAESAKASLLQVQSEIKKLQAEKDNMLAKMESAKARIRIQEQLDGLRVDAEVKALDNVREHIKTPSRRPTWARSWPSPLWISG